MLSSLSASRRTHHLAALGLAVLLLLTAALASVPAQAAPLAQNVFPGTVDWDSEPQIVSNGRRSGFPRVAVDANNITHVIYATEQGSIMYTNNRGGAFDLGGKALAGAGYDSTPNVAIAAGPNNTIHAVYARPQNNNRVYYRLSPDGGQTWFDQQPLSDAPKSWNPDVAVDPATGDAHIVWIDNRCGSQYNVYYRVRRANGSMSSTQSPRTECGTYQNRPSITFAGGKPHVVYYRAGEINYTRLEGGSWIKPINISKTSTTSQNPSVTSDGNNGIFVAWDENTNGHDIRFIASFDGGNSWSNWIPFSDSDPWASHPYATWSPVAKRAHVVWADKTGSDDGQEEIWERQFDPVSLQTTAADQVSHFDGHSLWPAIAVGPERADIVWHDNTDSTYQIWDWGGKVIGATPTGCKGTLSLNGEMVGTIKATRSRTLAGTITPEANCVPEQMQVAVNGPVTDATPKVPYNANISVTAGGGCGQTVSVRLFRGGVGAEPFSDSVIVDTGADAFVQVTNPHLSGMPAFPDSPKPGANDGDRNYTREPKFFLSVEDIGDCIGLDTFNITGGDSGLITNGSASAWPTLSSIATAGEKSMVVNVTDKMDYKISFERSIIYDPNPPELDTTENPTATAPLSTSTILVPLAFDNIKVTDDQFGPREGLPADAEFWGVLVANSTTKVAITSPALNWLPVQVSASDSFTVNWSLLSGLSDPPERAAGGDIYIYVRFIDGAGNISEDGITVRKVSLEPNFDLPTRLLPIIFR
jgi:hypothetical protein